jgi:hypothetical protein
LNKSVGDTSLETDQRVEEYTGMVAAGPVEPRLVGEKSQNRAIGPRGNLNSTPPCQLRPTDLVGAPRQGVGGSLEQRIRAEFGPEAIHRHLELKLPDRSENRNSLSSIARLKGLNNTLLVQLGNAFSELFVTGGIEIAGNPEVFRGESGNRWEFHDTVDTETVPDPQFGCVYQTHDISRKGYVDRFSVSPEYLVCVLGRERTPGAMIRKGHPPLEPSRADPQECDPVAMPGMPHSPSTAERVP